MSRGKKGPFLLMSFSALAGACHVANACQSACWPVGRHCSDLDVFWLLAVLTAVFEPVTLTIHLKDVDVMGQAVQQSSCEPFGTKDFGPFIKG